VKQDYTIPRGQLDGVDAFLRVAERRSFRAAAVDLGVSPSSVSQTVRALEARVGVALLTRTTRSVGLTQAGELFVERARPAFADLSAAYDAARSLGQRPAGLLRLNMPRSVFPVLIEPILAGFCEAYPEIEVEICAEDSFVDLVEGGFDAGIRLGEFLQADMVAVRLTPSFRFVVVGAPEYLARFGRPERPADLRRHRCIRVRLGRGIGDWEFMDGNRPLSVTVTGPLIVNDIAVDLAGALGGIGLAYVAEPLVLDHLADGRLEVVLERYAPASPGVFLYYPSRAQTLPKLRAFIDYVRDKRPIEAVRSEMERRTPSGREPAPMPAIRSQVARSSS
jgi:DNA-binding transcriptional LysR family regulator